MTSATLTFPASAFGLVVADPAIGRDADVVREAVRRIHAPETSIFYDARLQWQGGIVDLIRDAAMQGGLDATTLQQALALLHSLPVWAPSPEVALENDGQIGFDWVIAPDRVISLNIGRDSMVGYASRIGLESSFGRLPFAGILPQRIRELLARVVEEGESGHQP